MATFTRKQNARTLTITNMIPKKDDLQTFLDTSNLSVKFAHPRSLYSAYFETGDCCSLVSSWMVPFLFTMFNEAIAVVKPREREHNQPFNPAKVKMGDVASEIMVISLYDIHSLGHGERNNLLDCRFLPDDMEPSFEFVLRQSDDDNILITLVTRLNTYFPRLCVGTQQLFNGNGVESLYVNEMYLRNHVSQKMDDLDPSCFGGPLLG